MKTAVGHKPDPDSVWSRVKNHEQWFIYGAFTRYSALLRPFRRFRHSYLVCSEYLSTLTIFWKISLLFDQDSVDCIWQKSPHKYHSLHKSRFDSTAKFYFCQDICGFVVFSMVTRKYTVLARPWRPFGLFLPTLRPQERVSASQCSFLHHNAHTRPLWVTTALLVAVILLNSEINVRLFFSFSGCYYMKTVCFPIFTCRSLSFRF